MRTKDVDKTPRGICAKLQVMEDARVMEASISGFPVNTRRMTDVSAPYLIANNPCVLLRCCNESTSCREVRPGLSRPSPFKIFPCIPTEAFVSASRHPILSHLLAKSNKAWPSALAMYTQSRQCVSRRVGISCLVSPPFSS